MAASVTYTVWDGQVVSEDRAGVLRDYVPDPLGNTIALLDSGHNITDSWTYWPYGEVQSHGGSSTTPFTFLGTLGYFVDFLNQLYVRARHLRVELTRWVTVDPQWPRQASYSYARSSPTVVTDSTGSVPQWLSNACKFVLFSAPAGIAVGGGIWLWHRLHDKPAPPKRSSGPERLCEIICSDLICAGLQGVANQICAAACVKAGGCHDLYSGDPVWVIAHTCTAASSSEAQCDDCCEQACLHAGKRGTSRYGRCYNVCQLGSQGCCGKYSDDPGNCGGMQR